jgi:hypothetical protein
MAFLILPVMASAGSDVDHLRLIVGFKNGSTTKERQAKYAAENGEIVETFLSIGADLVVLQDKKNESEAENAASAKQICDRFLSLKTFVSCEPDRRLKFNAESVTCRDCNKSHRTVSKASTSETVSAKCEVEPVAGLIDPQKGRDSGKDGKWNVSPLWGQHAIGADLAADFTSAQFQTGKIQRVPIGNIDIIAANLPNSPISADATKIDLAPEQKPGWRPHGNVTSDLVDKPPFGVSPVVTWAFLANLASGERSLTGWNSRLIKSLELASKSKARLITASVGYFGSSPRSSVDHFVSSGKIFVQSAGNDYPVKAWGGAAPIAGHIIVGSVGPNGLPTPFSQEPVKVYAPSDGAQVSGPNETFGGTSGATPLVSGSLTNALASLPGLTNEEAETLLERTSLPGFATETPGIVNAYRLAVVADCLGAEWPKSRATLLKTGANSQKCFDQSKLAQEKLESANRLLFSGSGCEAKRDGLRSLRASYLLLPTAQKARQISRIYKELGFKGDARWYETMAASLGTAAEQRKLFQSLMREPSLAVHRYFAGSTVGASSRGAYAMSLASRLPESHEFVKLAQADIARLANSENPADRIEAVERAGFLGPFSVPAILPALEKSEDYGNPIAAGPFFGRLTAADGVPNPWEPLLRERLKGTPFTKFLPQSNR